jgi:AcrR family transcriptional regulator
VTERDRKRGRPPGGSNSRADILAAARAEFEDQGYDAATMRAIGRRAGVDPAMIHHYFGNKENLFLAAMDLRISPDDVVNAIASGPKEQLGERAVRTFLRVWGEPSLRGPLLALLRSAMTNNVAATLLRQFITRILLGRMEAVFGGLPDSRLRAEAVASQMVGLGILRFVVKIEPLASASEDELVELMGPVIQGYFARD